MKRLIPAIVSVVMFMEFLDTTIINTAIPSIAKSFQQDPILLKFAVTSYFLSLAIFTPISGWIADKLGTRKVFLTSVTLFVVASFLCGVSHNIIELTFFRFLQGMGGAFMNPVSRIIIIRLFPPNEIVRVQGIIFTPALLGFVVGPFLGGFITTYYSWNWIFLINIPIGLVVLYLAYKFIPEQKDLEVKRFDFFGFILSAVSLGCISFAVDMTGHEEVVSKYIVNSMGIGGFFLFTALVFHCIKKKNPVLDFLILNIKTFRIGLLAAMGMYMISASIAFLLPLMYQGPFEYSPFYSGSLILPIAAGQCIFRFFAPKIINLLGFKYSMLISCLFIIISLICLAHIKPSTPHYLIMLLEFIFGSSIVIHMSSTGALNYIDVPKPLSSKATALDLTTRQFFSSLGVGISALLIHSLRNYFSVDINSDASIHIFQNTILAISLIGVFSFVNALFLDRKEGEHALKR